LNNQCSSTNGEPFEISIEKKVKKINGLNLISPHLTSTATPFKHMHFSRNGKNGLPLKVKIKELLSLNIKSG
jgi:hypothetical protein